MHTRITELLGIRLPIVQGGMHYVGLAELASAVSNAGGLGILTALTQRTPELLAQEIGRCRAMTDRPFGVNLTFLPTFAAPPYAEYIRAIIEGGVTVVETAGRSPEAHLPALQAAGVKVVHKCTSVRHALKAERIGCDAVSIDGFECGGHPGRRRCPQHDPSSCRRGRAQGAVLASGGMADGRSLVAALALGADGIAMGTRFLATREAPVHDNVKQALLRATELDTRLVMRSLRNTERVLNNPAVTSLLDIERQRGETLTIDDIHDQVAGVYPRVMRDGEVDSGAWSCGLVAGLITDIPSVRDLLDRIMEQAAQIINERLSGFVATAPGERLFEEVA